MGTEGKRTVRTAICMGAGSRYAQRGVPLEGSQWEFDGKSGQCNGGEWRPRFRVGGGYVPFPADTPQTESQPPLYAAGFTETT